MRAILIVGAVLALAGCDRVVPMCEKAIKAKLKAPATYKLVSVRDLGPEWREISYDAENSYGVPIRSSGNCFFDPAANTVSWFEHPKSD